MIVPPDYLSLTYGKWRIHGSPKGWNAWWKDYVIIDKKDFNHVELKRMTLPELQVQIFAFAGRMKRSKRDPGWERMLVTLDGLLEASWPWPPLPSSTELTNGVDLGMCDSVSSVTIPVSTSGG